MTSVTPNPTQKTEISGDISLREYTFRGILLNGFVSLTLLIAIVICLIWYFISETSSSYGEPSGRAMLTFPVAFILVVFWIKGLFIQEPNESRVMMFFGKYVGTCRQVGFYWANPFVTRRKISLRICNMDIDPIKVNDLEGNPVMIGMVLVWRIKDTYRAVFDVANSTPIDLDRFVRIQGDAALREVTGQFAYDDTDGRADGLTLRSSGDEISELLEHKINERLAMAGIEVVEARLNYLAYAPEIAAVMLRRQQAAAIISAREKIVEGAVSMVKMAVDRLERDKVVNLPEDRKGALVSNLLVVLCSDEPASPVLQTGER